MAHILLIEDDPVLGPRLRNNLELSGYRVTLATIGQTGLHFVLNGAADLIILDLMLPGLDGMKILHEMRKKHVDTPVIILTAKGAESDRLEGFNEGCDDYVTKPFSLMELIARVRAVLKRCGYREESHAINSGGVTLDPGSRTLLIGEKRVDISPREFDLLRVLLSHPNQALSRYYLLDEVWGEESDLSTRTVDAHIAYLRKKLEDCSGINGVIETVYKVGYMWFLGGGNENCIG